VNPSLPPPPRPDLSRAAPPRPDLPRPPSPRRRRGLVRWIAAGVVCLVLAGIGGLARGPGRGSDGAGAGDTGVSSERSYRFVARTAEGGPVRWNPCEPIRYQIDLGPMAAGVAEEVHDSTALISEATGIGFTFEGFVEVDIAERLAGGDFVIPGSEGGIEWAPVLVAWRPQRFLLALGAERDVLGLGLPVATRLDRDQFVSGAIVLNADARLPRGFATGLDQGPVILHELGHVLGLGHVSDRSQLMFRRAVPWVTGLGEGDLQGLERLGVGDGCLVTPTAELDAAVASPGLGLRR